MRFFIIIKELAAKIFSYFFLTIIYLLGIGITAGFIRILNKKIKENTGWNKFDANSNLEKMY